MCKIVEDYAKEYAKNSIQEAIEGRNWQMKQRNWQMKQRNLLKKKNKKLKKKNKS
ncbi:MAG: hypothetical protein ACLRMX_06790 [Lachnospira eligens]